MPELRRRFPVRPKAQHQWGESVATTQIDGPAGPAGGELIGCDDQQAHGAFQPGAQVRGIDGPDEAQCSPAMGRLEIVMKSKGRPRGTDNVLADLGFDDAEDLSAKAILAIKLNELIDTRGLSQNEAAHITGMTQPKVSQVRRYKLQNIAPNA